MCIPSQVQITDERKSSFSRYEADMHAIISGSYYDDFSWQSFLVLVLAVPCQSSTVKGPWFACISADSQVTQAYLCSLVLG